MAFGNFWITCIYPEEKGLLYGSKVHLTQCMECPIKKCEMKAASFQAYFTEAADTGKSVLNRKIMELNQKLGVKVSPERLYCPKKSSVTTKCAGLSVFCKQNTICGRYKIREGRLFIRSLRWRRTMIYVVKFLDGTVETVDRNDFGGVNIDKVEIVYPGNLEVEVVTELVPQGEEAARLKETVSAFREKYAGDVVTDKGIVSFEEWFTGAATGERAVIPEKALIPVKTYRVVRIKSGTEVKEKRKEETPQPIPQQTQPAQPKPVQSPPAQKAQTPPPAETPKTAAAIKKPPVKNTKKEDDVQPSLFNQIPDKKEPKEKPKKVPVTAEKKKK